MPTIQLRPMTAPEFDELRSSTIVEYADEQVRAGLVEVRDALETAKGHLDELLPDGLYTNDMHLLTGELPDHRVVGYVWFQIRPLTPPRVSAWLYAIEVLPQLRRKGYGRELLAAVELEVARRGASSLGLHVFANNDVARRLYSSAGFELTAQQMRKTL